ncbi:MAG TPA: hypothetical protein VFD27_01735, partial [Chthoniobacteraceae bacterium]|nr:hypothetical protein [Chthoniobacteraceae bacterium]
KPTKRLDGEKKIRFGREELPLKRVADTFRGNASSIDQPTYAAPRFVRARCLAPCRGAFSRNSAGRVPGWKRRLALLLSVFRPPTFTHPCFPIHLPSIAGFRR